MPARSVIVLDSGPLGLLLRRRGVPPADACRTWLRARISENRRIIIPEIADSEVRRELLRLNSHQSIGWLDALCDAHVYLPISTQAMRQAAELWATARMTGRPTDDPHALDGDVILSAEVLASGLPLDEVIVASTNVVHLTRFVPADTGERVV